MPSSEVSNRPKPTPAQSLPSRVIIVHGYAASAAAHWFPWLHRALTAQGITCTIVNLPSPGTPEKSAWDSALAKTIGSVDEGTWIIAHSLGAITSLRYLHTCPRPWSLGGLVTVSGFTGRLPNLPELDDYLAEDINDEDLQQIAENIRTRICLRSDDDEVVAPHHSDELAARLNAPVTVVPGAGHFLGKDGWTSFPGLLAAMKVSPLNG